MILDFRYAEGLRSPDGAAKIESVMAVTDPLMGETLIEPEPQLVPLRPAGAGRLNVGPSRVSLDSVIYAFEEGETPEGIVDRFPSLELADVYQAVAYYLKHPGQVKAYLAKQEQGADNFLGRSEKQFGPSSELRARLLARRSAKVF